MEGDCRVKPWKIFDFLLPITDQSWHNMETSQLIYAENQLTGFYILAMLFINR